MSLRRQRCKHYGECTVSDRSEQFMQEQRNLNASSVEDIRAINQRLERQVKKYEQAIKRDILSFISESTPSTACCYKDKYGQLLARPIRIYRPYFK